MTPQAATKKVRVTRPPSRSFEVPVIPQVATKKVRVALPPSLEFGSTSDAAGGNEESTDDPAVDDVDIPFEFTVGLRLSNTLIYTTREKQLYRKDKKYGANGFYYRFNVEGCPVRLFYDAQLNKCSRRRIKSTQHSHGDQEKTNKSKIAKVHQRRVHGYGWIL